MVFKWRNERIESFLDYYRNYDCLWNTSSNLYKNKIVRENAYGKLCADMRIPELTIADIKNKIKIIRTTVIIN